MDTQPFDAFVPRLRSLEGGLTELRRDLALAIHEASYEEPEAARPAVAPEAPRRLQQRFQAEQQQSEDRPMAASPARPSWPSLEQLVGGKALHLAGLLLVFLGTGFFLKEAFDRNWIHPPERIALGIVGGIALLIYAQFLARRELRYFSDGITALGAAIEFLSLYAAGPLFHLFSPGEVFVGMATVSATVATLGWHHRSERLGIFGAIGGFLTPLLIGATSSNEWMLASYLAAFSTGLFALSELLDSKILAPLAFGGVLFYGIAHFCGAPIPAVERAAILGMLYATVALALWVSNRLRPSDDPIRVLLACGALAIYTVALFGLISDDRTLLATILFGLAIVHCSATLLERSQHHTWMSVALLTLAIPVEFNGAAAAAGWAIEALGLVVIGLLTNDVTLRVGGYVLLGVGLLRDFEIDAALTATTPIWNERFVSLFALVAAIFGANAALALKPFRTKGDVQAGSCLRVAGHVVALWMLTAELWDYSNGATSHMLGTQAANTAVSILWTLYATGLIATGLRRRDAILRWSGLVLIVTATAKVLIFDLSFLDLAYRVLSGLIVGIVLIGVSYAYQRRMH